MVPIYILAGIAVFCVIIWKWKPKQKAPVILSKEDIDILDNHVRFYQRLNEPDKQRFREKIGAFLANVRIQGIGATLEERDRIYVASSAVIPIFGFPEWEYRNLTDVLIYPDTFNEEFKFEGKDRAIMGMVGSGYMNGKMILSQHALR
ncbi:MAG: zinc-dependent peptidase, partial [Chitinophagaceae bacterium]|nr:zinc-dependent peptidase [Chitinophagaceae bacterium]